MKSLFEQNGGTYRIVGDYCIPNLDLSDEYEYHIGIWGLRRLNYLKNHKCILYVNLLTSDKLTEHLCEIDTEASERFEIIVRQMAMASGHNRATQSGKSDALGW